MNTEITEEYSKEVALLSVLIRQENLFNESTLQQFDKVYEIAKNFITVFTLDNNQWNEFCYETYVVEFAKRQVSEKLLKEAFEYLYEIDIDNSLLTHTEHNKIFNSILNNNDDRVSFEIKLREYQMVREHNSKF